MLPPQYATEVVGESNYQDALQTISGKPTRDGREIFEAVLVLDDANPYDAQAVKVLINDPLVGYLSREDARTHRWRLKGFDRDGAAIRCPAVIRGGWDRGGGDAGMYDVRIELPTA